MKAEIYVATSSWGSCKEKCFHGLHGEMFYRFFLSRSALGKVKRLFEEEKDVVNILSRLLLWSDVMYSVEVNALPLPMKTWIFCLFYSLKPFILVELMISESGELQCYHIQEAKRIVEEKSESNLV